MLLAANAECEIVHHGSWARAAVTKRQEQSEASLNFSLLRFRQKLQAVSRAGGRRVRRPAAQEQVSRDISGRAEKLVRCECHKYKAFAQATRKPKCEPVGQRHQIGLRHTGRGSTTRENRRMNQPD